MDYSRRDVVKVAGVGAAAATLSCASAGTGMTGAGATELEPPETVHTVDVTLCRGEQGAAGQYAVVESKTNKPRKSGGNIHSFRGKLEAFMGETVEIRNRTGDEIKLYFPEPKIFGEETGTEVTLGKGEKFQRTFAELGSDGRYEYAVLYKRTVLGNESESYRDGAIWGFAIGGSSSEFIIRRPPSP